MYVNEQTQVFGRFVPWRYYSEQSGAVVLQCVFTPLCECVFVFNPSGNAVTLPARRFPASIHGRAGTGPLSHVRGIALIQEPTWIIRVTASQSGAWVTQTSRFPINPWGSLFFPLWFQTGFKKAPKTLILSFWLWIIHTNSLFTLRGLSFIIRTFF